MGTLTASTYSVGEQIMKHKFQFSYKRQKLLTFTLVGSSLLVCLMSQAREFPSIKLPQKEYLSLIHISHDNKYRNSVHLHRLTQF